ncbi:MAG: xylose isomerase [Eubacteriales bacterium]
MKEFFPNVPKVEYKGVGGDALSFKFYNPEEVINGKSMKDHMRFAMSYWHTLCGDGTDIFGSGTQDKSFGGNDPMEVAKNKAYAGFEIMNKLGIDFFCFHDRDVAPEQATLTETNKVLDQYVDILEELMGKYNKKLLWGTTNAFGNPRFTNGAATNNNADVFAFAAAQIKKAIEITVRLKGEGYVFWGGREGYMTLMNTNLGLEQDNLARMLTMARDYGRSIGFKGDFYIEPKPMEPTTHQYDYDVATCLAFLRKYDLMDDFRMNVEANHATLAGHTFAHELCVARENGVFGSIDANKGETFNGWDTDNFPTDVYDATMAMVQVIKAGGFTKGGTNFDAKLRRASIGADDVFKGYIAGMDTMALGFKLASKIIDDGRLDNFIADRYSSYKSGIGAKIVAGTTDLAELEKYALDLGEVTNNTSGRQEEFEGILNSIIFG